MRIVNHRLIHLFVMTVFFVSIVTQRLTLMPYKDNLFTSRDIQLMTPSVVYYKYFVSVTLISNANQSQYKLHENR